MASLAHPILLSILSRLSLSTRLSLNSGHVSRSCFELLASAHLTSCSATKLGAIVAGQTSVKAPEKAAFEKHLPPDVEIVSCHSLHGPTVSPADQPLVRPISVDPTAAYLHVKVLIKHRASDEALKLVENILRPLRSRYVYLSYEEHDSVTANTQAVTHAAFLRCASTAWIFLCRPHLPASL